MDWFTWWCIFALGVGVIAATLGRSFLGWTFLAVIISPLIAVIIVALVGRGGDEEAGPTPDTHVKCPDCAELVLKEARVCKHCHCRLVPQP